MKERLEERVVSLLRQRGQSISCAESCTGGLLAKRLTDVAGASAVFPGAVVSYCDRIKAQILGIPEQVLLQYGAVSAPVALAMAQGAGRLMRSDFALATTGVAGPQPDERGNPVGRIFVALATPWGQTCVPLELGEQGRDTLRYLAAETALNLLLDTLERPC